MTSVSFVTRVVMNDFPKIRTGMEQRAGQIVRKTALDLEAQMKVRAPNLTGYTPSGAESETTGFLRNSIQAEKLGRSHWRVTVGADYGIYQEYGTRVMEAQPFFFPAIAEVRPGFMAAMRTIVA